MGGCSSRPSSSGSASEESSYESSPNRPCRRVVCCGSTSSDYWHAPVLSETFGYYSRHPRPPPREVHKHSNGNKRAQPYAAPIPQAGAHRSSGKKYYGQAPIESGVNYKGANGVGSFSFSTAPKTGTKTVQGQGQTTVQGKRGKSRRK